LNHSTKSKGAGCSRVVSSVGVSSGVVSEDGSKSRHNKNKLLFCKSRTAARWSDHLFVMSEEGIEPAEIDIDGCVPLKNRSNVKMLSATRRKDKNADSSTTLQALQDSRDSDSAREKVFRILERVAQGGYRTGGNIINNIKGIDHSTMEEQQMQLGRKNIGNTVAEQRRVEKSGGEAPSSGGAAAATLLELGTSIASVTAVRLASAAAGAFNMQRQGSTFFMRGPEHPFEDFELDLLPLLFNFYAQAGLFRTQLVHFLRRFHNFQKSLGGAGEEQHKSALVRGNSLTTGLPKSLSGGKTSSTCRGSSLKNSCRGGGVVEDTSHRS
ncbi:unnamed protein product, partial [Amoebophrya sp. A25]